MATATQTSYWQSTYWYPSNTYVGNAESSYRMKSYRQNDELIFESLPNEEGSYMFIRLRIDGNIAVGSWHETTSPTGEFEGAQYSGSGQLVINDKTGNMEGMWAGAGYDHKLKQMQIYSGRWEIVREDEARNKD